MKEYPNIEGASKAPRQPCYGFVKYDGSNLRFKWSKKRGWFLFGSRTQLFNETHSWFGEAIPIFMQKYADPIAKIIQKEKIFRGTQNAIAFCEFFGAKSFAGYHEEKDPKTLVLFDINTTKHGILNPTDFIEYFGELPETAEIIYRGNLNEPLINGVREGTLDCISKFPIKTEIPEGIVCKGGNRHKLWMAKIKTTVYRETIRARFRSEWRKYWE